MDEEVEIEAAAMLVAPAAALQLHDHDDDEQPQPVYCAVGGIGKNEEEWKANLQWVLANEPRSKRLVLAHLRRPPSRINMSSFLASSILLLLLFCFLLHNQTLQFILAASLYVRCFIQFIWS